MEQAVNKVISDLYQQENQRLEEVRRRQEALELLRRENEIKAIAYDRIRFAEIEKALQNKYKQDAYYLIFNPYEYYSGYADQENIINKTLRIHYSNEPKYRIEIKYHYTYQKQVDEAARNGNWYTVKTYWSNLMEHCPENLRPYAERLFKLF